MLTVFYIVTFGHMDNGELYDRIRFEHGMFLSKKDCHELAMKLYTKFEIRETVIVSPKE